jgi:hypothetical protein
MYVCVRGIVTKPVPSQESEWSCICMLEVDDIHKRHDKLDIYFFITITGSISLATGGLLVPKVIIAEYCFHYYILQYLEYSNNG